MTSLGITAASIAALGLVAQLSTCQPTIDLTTVNGIAKGLCSFTTDLTTINQLIHANGSLKTAEDIAVALCGLVNTNKTAATGKVGAEAPTTSDVTFVTNYNGTQVTIHGKVVK